MANQRLKELLTDTITLLCKNGLEFEHELSVDALIGVTLDKKQVVLLSIRENVVHSAKEPQNTTSKDFHETKSKYTGNDVEYIVEDLTKEKLNNESKLNGSVSERKSELNGSNNKENATTEENRIKKEKNLSHSEKKDNLWNEFQLEKKMSIGSFSPHANIKVDNERWTYLDQQTRNMQLMTGQFNPSQVKGEYNTQENHTSPSSINHQQMHFQNMSPTGYGNGNQIYQQRRFQCTQCPKFYSNSHGLLRHKQVEHLRCTSSQCTECGKTFSRKDHMLRHVRSEHLKIGSVSCPHCGKVFYRKDKLTLHLGKCQKALSAMESDVNFTANNIISTSSNSNTTQTSNSNTNQLNAANNNQANGSNTNTQVSSGFNANMPSAFYTNTIMTGYRDGMLNYPFTNATQTLQPLPNSVFPVGIPCTNISPQKDLFILNHNNHPSSDQEALLKLGKTIRTVETITN